MDNEKMIPVPLDYLKRLARTYRASHPTQTRYLWVSKSELLRLLANCENELGPASAEKELGVKFYFGEYDEDTANDARKPEIKGQFTLVAIGSMKMDGKFVDATGLLSDPDNSNEHPADNIYPMCPPACPPNSDLV
jgi:hypothetical protein